VSSAETVSAALAFAPTRETLEAAIALIERDPAASGSAIDAPTRRAAFAEYESLPIPGTKPGRGWRHDYTKLRYDDLRWSSDRMTVATVPFGAVAPAEAAADVDRPALATENAGGLVHLGATLLEPRERGIVDPRITLLPLADAKRAGTPPVDGKALDDLTRTILTGDKFAQLAIAFQNCGAFVYVPDGVVVEAPIQLVFANAEPNAEAVFPHIVVVLGAGACATVIERHVGEGRPFVCGLVVAHVGEGAQLDYVAIQQAGDEARILMERGASCERGAKVRWHVAELGGTLVRSVVDARLAGSGAEAQTSALFFNTGMQHVDLTTTTAHPVGETASDTVVRTAASDRGQGRYFGNIVIHQKAHGSDASLRDDALLLSKRAHIDSVPALEIAANDVKAYHGATVGSLDQDALFYAESRGIARIDAARMVALAFFEPAIARFPGETLRDEVRTALDQKIDDATELDA
jgi:Fe-S cluster assembly protein SufD